MAHAALNAPTSQSPGNENAWTLRVHRADQSLCLPSVAVTIAVAAIYAGIELDPPRVRALSSR